MLTLTPIVMEIRDGHEHKKYGDPYTVSANVIIYGDEALITRLVGTEFTKESFRTLYSSLREMGIKTVRWKRHKKDKIYERVKSL